LWSTALPFVHSITIYHTTLLPLFHYIHLLPLLPIPFATLLTISTDYVPFDDTTITTVDVIPLYVVQHYHLPLPFHDTIAFTLRLPLHFAVVTTGYIVVRARYSTVPFLPYGSTLLPLFPGVRLLPTLPTIPVEFVLPCIYPVPFGVHSLHDDHHYIPCHLPTTLYHWTFIDFTVYITISIPHHLHCSTITHTFTILIW